MMKFVSGRRKQPVPLVCLEKGFRANVTLKVFALWLLRHKLHIDDALEYLSV